MKLFINASAESLNSLIDSSFGRCNFFLVFETENDKYEFIKNPHQDSQESVGAAVAQTAIDLGINAVIGVNPGPRAFNLLKEANIAVYHAEPDKKLKEVIVAFTKNELIQLDAYLPYQSKK